MILPQKTKEGKPYISYSQWQNWIDLSSFNLKEKGIYEYFIKYFYKYDFGDVGWAQFGNEVEGYITNREHSESFTDKERYVLDSINPLGEFQKYFEIDMGEFVVVGYMDDFKEGSKESSAIIRDYKTASLNSSKRYHKDDYYQLDLYAMWHKQHYGTFPELEVVVIERKGNCMFGGGRGMLSVGNDVWYITRETNQERQEYLKNSLIETAKEISEYYKLYKSIIKNG